LLDGDEILIYGTFPYNHDSDFDTYSDGLELFIGTDPMTFTTEEEFLRKIRQLNHPLQIRSPENGKMYDSGNIPIQVVSAVELTEAWFRYRVYDINNASHGAWSENYTLSFKRVTTYSLGAWTSNEINFANGSMYQLEVYGIAPEFSYETSDRQLSNVLLTNDVVFEVSNTYWLGINPTYFYAGGGVLTTGVLMAVLTRRGTITPKNWISKLRRGKQ